MAARTVASGQLAIAIGNPCPHPIPHGPHRPLAVASGGGSGKGGSVVVAAAVAMVVEVVVVVDPLVKLTFPFAQQAIAIGNTNRQQQ